MFENLRPEFYANYKEFVEKIVNSFIGCMLLLLVICQSTFYL